MIDPRATSAEKLVPKAPLPHVSRRALKRVRGYLPPPDSCKYCNGEVELTRNSEVYRGREYGDWPFVYLCRSCDAYVGLHPDTDLPLGTMANKELRDARKVEKAKFEALWKGGRGSRTKAYRWLAQAMGINVDECHWGWFDVEQCRRAGELCRARAQGREVESENN